MADRLLNREEILDITGLGRTTQWRLENEGGFPARRKIGPGRVAWLASEVEAWMRALPHVPAVGRGAER